jgi:hypothetical protein
MIVYVEFLLLDEFEEWRLRVYTGQ